MYVFEVKSPAESREHWDYLKTLATIPGEQGFQPLSTSNCRLLNKEGR
jgi:branched-chain amino acid transport system substrate-binding protein